MATLTPAWIMSRYRWGPKWVWWWKYSEARGQ